MINIGINETNRQAVINKLNQLLADEFVLYVKTRNLHWNVETNNFNELHKFFEAQYEILDQFLDQIAERTRTLEGKATATLAAYKQITRLPEEPVNCQSQASMMQALLHDHETIIRNLRSDVEACTNQHGDQGTSDFLTGLMEEHEKMAWMVRAYLKTAR